jgi:hypothetical protein
MSRLILKRWGWLACEAGQKGCGDVYQACNPRPKWVKDRQTCQQITVFDYHLNVILILDNPEVLSERIPKAVSIT